MIYAGNWKLHFSPKQSQEFLQELNQASQASEREEIVLFPMASSWVVFSDKNDIKWGAQNICSAASGAFTGENSPQVLKELGGSFALIGHSERRVLFKESDEWIHKKIEACEEFGLQPVLCIGETESERKSGQTQDVLRKQLDSVVLNQFKAPQFILAYEPVWAIGTGLTPTVEEVQETFAFLNAELKSRLPPTCAFQIWYGGSVKPDNAKDLKQVGHLSGFLIGGASLKVKDLLSIVRA